MTASRRSRRTPPLSDPEERLRGLGLDSSPAVQPPRDHASGSLSDPAPAVVLPRPPYAVDGAESPYIPEERPSGRSGHWTSLSPPGPLWNGTAGSPSETERPPGDPLDPETAPTVRITPNPVAEPPPPLSARKAPPPTHAEGGPSPWASELTGANGAFSSALWNSTSERHDEGRQGDPADDHTSRGPGDPPKTRNNAAGQQHGGVTPSVHDPVTGPSPAPRINDPDKRDRSLGGHTTVAAAGTPESIPDEDPGGRQRRGAAVRPPSGYTELTPETPDSVLERVAERWGSRSSLSRRAVVALLVLGLLAVAGALLVVRDRPEEVVVPELAGQASPAGQDASEQPAPGDDGAAGEPGGDVVVHVGGEVVEPGLYTMPGGSRVADAVEEAGGPLPEADLDLVNLARPLTDGERVLVGVPQPDGGSGEGPEGGGPLVDINLAGQSELETLPGIGQKKAQQILAHRESLGGRFGSTEDLLGVDGIAEKTFRTLEPHVTVG